MSSGQGSKFWGVVLTLGLTTAALIFLIATMEGSRVMTNFMPVFGMIAGAGIFYAILRGPIGKAIAKMLEGQSMPNEQLVIRVENLEDRLAESGMDQLRMAELEERLDFAERLLSQREPVAALKQPEH